MKYFNTLKDIEKKYRKICLFLLYKRWKYRWGYNIWMGKENN